MDALIELRQRARSGDLNPSEATVGDLLDKWWEARSDHWEASTRARWSGIVRHHLRPRWQDVPLRSVTLADLEQWFADLARSGSVRFPGQPLSPQSVRQTRTVLSNALDLAYRWEWIPSNPASRARIVPQRKTRIEATPPELVQRLIARCDARSEAFGVWVRVAATTGMRRSEMAALRWQDVDLGETPSIWVHRAVVPAARKLVLKETKTHLRHRIYLDRWTADVLRAHRKSAAATEGDALVWSESPDGLEPVSPNKMSKAWVAVRDAEAETDPRAKTVRLHDLRHFTATQAISAGHDIGRVSARLGHANVSTTLNIYADFIESEDVDVAESISSALAPLVDDEG